MNAADLCFTSAVELAGLIRRRALSPVEITRAVLERIERLNPRARRLRPRPRRASARPRRGAAEQAVMAGRPLGAAPRRSRSRSRTICGRPATGPRSARACSRDFVAPEDAPSVAGLRAAGAIFVGRTNLPEFAWRGSTDNPPVRRVAQPVGSHAHARWVDRRRSGGRRGRTGAAGARLRRGRLDSNPGQLLRARRPEAHVRARADVSGRRRQRAGRPRLPARAHRARRGADDERDRPARSARRVRPPRRRRGLPGGLRASLS